MRSVFIGLLAAWRQRVFHNLSGSPVARAPRISGKFGFTLLETLTALAILSIALVSLLEAQSTGLRAVGNAELYGQARMLAQSLLAEGVSVIEERPRGLQGQRGPFRWAIVATEVGEPITAVNTKVAWRLHHVRVIVSWGRNRSITLNTLKMARAPSQR